MSPEVRDKRHPKCNRKWGTLRPSVHVRVAGSFTEGCAHVRSCLGCGNGPGHGDVRTSYQESIIRCLFLKQGCQGFAAYR